MDNEKSTEEVEGTTTPNPPQQTSREQELRAKFPGETITLTVDIPSVGPDYKRFTDRRSIYSFCLAKLAVELDSAIQNYLGK